MMTKEKNFVSAVIYVHNAEDRIEAFLKAIIGVMETHFEQSEIICVNDCSDDNSKQVIKAVSDCATKTSVSILNMSYYHGLETAMNAGVDLSIGDFVLEFDSTELNFDPEDIMKVYFKSLQGYDIVSAAVERKNRASSSLFYRVFNRFAHLSYQLRTEDFRILSRRAINRISSMNKTVPYRKAVYANSGFQTAALTLEATTTAGGSADREEKRQRRRLAIDSLILFTDLGYRFSIVMAIVMMAAALLMAVYSIVVFSIGAPVEGWTTTVLFLAVAFFGLFGVLAIVIKYLQILVDLVFKRKHYTFESIEKLTK